MEAKKLPLPLIETSIQEQIEIDDNQQLLCPGPVNVAEEVKTALVHSDIGHREHEFSALLKRARSKLSTIFGVRNTLKFTTVIVNGSGSAANEAVFSSLGRDKHILVVANGEFGDRLIDLANFYQDNVDCVQLRWGNVINLAEVEAAIKHFQPDMIAMVHHETSTGMLNPISQVGKLAKQYELEFFVDAVSSLGAENVDVEKNHITFCTSSSNKALASVCGLSFVCGRVSEFEALRDKRRQTRYLDLYRHYRYEHDRNQTPNTPSLTVYFALDAALNRILKEGLNRRLNRIGRLARLLREEMKRLGYQAIIDKKHMSRVLTTFRMPDHFSYEDIRYHLKKNGFVIYGGKGPLENKVFQVANIGEIDESAIRNFVFTMSLLERN